MIERDREVSVQWSRCARMNERVCVCVMCMCYSNQVQLELRHIPNFRKRQQAEERTKRQRYVCVCLTRESCFKRFLPETPNHCQNQIVKQSYREMTRLSLLKTYIFLNNAQKGKKTQPKRGTTSDFSLFLDQNLPSKLIHARKAGRVLKRYRKSRP